MRRREAMQVVKSALNRLFGRPQPFRAEILAARSRVDQGVSGDPARDRCLARGYCCETGCRACPWSAAGRH